MRHFNSASVGRLFAAGLFCLGSLNVQAAMPANEYACQVTAQGGRIGLVLVQADTKEQAEAAAVGVEAFTYDGVRSRSTGVMECIERGRERFSDIQFQAFYQSVPL